MSDRRKRRSGRYPKRPLIEVDVCCNDPDNGLFAGRAQQMMIADIEFESRDWRSPPRFVELDSGFRLSGKVWAVEGSTYGIGNWCWNRYWLKRLEAADFVNWLRTRRLFSVTCAPTVFYDWFNGEGPAMDRILLASLLEKT